jgi:hypothetical protein
MTPHAFGRYCTHFENHFGGIFQSFPPAGGKAIVGQFRVWPFLPAAIATAGERNRNPGSHFAGDYNIMDLLGKSDFRTKF